MIIDIIEKAEEKDSNEVFENLVKNFNELAKKEKSKYMLGFDSFGDLFLTKSIIFKIGTSIKPIKVNFSNAYFYFKEGIDSEIFEEIKEIIKKLNEQFLVEILV